MYGSLVDFYVLERGILAPTVYKHVLDLEPSNITDGGFFSPDT